MRIAYLLADRGIPVTGTKGASVHVQEMLRALSIDHNVDLFCARLGDGHNDLPVNAFHVLPELTRRRSVDAVIERDRQRLEAVSRLHCMVEHAHRARQYDFIYERYSLLSDVGASLADSFGIPLVVEVNAPLILERQRVEPLPLAPLAYEIERYVFERSDVLLAVSSAMRTYIIEHGGRPATVHVVPNGVDTARFHQGVSGDAVRHELGLGKNLVIGFAGSLKPWHGVDVLLEAFSRLTASRCVLLIVGDGPQRETLEAQAIAHAGHTRVVFTGAVPHRRMPEYLAAMDMTVAPYRSVDDFYFSPLKLFEYLAMGKAMVASDVGQISDVIQHGENGWLVEPDNVPALIQALDLLVKNEKLRAAGGSSTGSKIMTWHEIAQRVATLVQASQPLGWPS